MTYTKYTNYGSKPWLFLVEEYGVPEDEAFTLMREAEFVAVREIMKRVNELGYKKVTPANA